MNEAIRSIWVVIPAYNEEKVIASVVKELIEFDSSYNIVIVDDGSSDETIAACSNLAVDILKHPVNLGQGAALATGIKYTLRNNADIIITYDADGQMCPDDIPALVKQITEKGFDIALGSRFISSSPKGITSSKKIVLKLATLFTRISTSLELTDTHNGFRAISADAAAKIRINQNQMAHASEILSEISRNKLKYKEVPVNIRYTKYSMAKGQSILNSFNILFELFTGDKK